MLFIINILNVMYRSIVFEKYTYSKLLLKSEMWERPNRHVAILSNEWVRCGHSNIMEAHKQYYENRKEEIALILYITCLESLVAENLNEKKLRFAILVPALLDNVTEKHNVSLHLKRLYEKRNSFIHNSKSLFLNYEDNDMEFIDNITAKFFYC